KSPEAARCDELAERYRVAWGNGTDQGFFLVTGGGQGDPRFDAGSSEGRLLAEQRAYFYDVAGRRFRAMTPARDRAFPIHRAKDGKALSVLVVQKLHRENQVDSFVDPSVLVIGLPSFEVLGPFEMKGRYDQVVLGTNGTGQPLFTFTVGTGKSETYTI